MPLPQLAPESISSLLHFPRKRSHQVDQLLQAPGGVRIYARLMKKLEVARRDQRLECTVTNEQALQAG